MKAIRTTNASKSTAAGSAKPIDLPILSGDRMKAANTEIMITAAEVTTRAPRWKPVTTEIVALRCPSAPIT